MSLDISKEAFEKRLKLPLEEGFDGWEGPLAEAKAKKKAKDETQKKANRKKEHNDDTLSTFLAEQYAKHEGKICPKAEDLFNAFKITPYDKVKVVIVGQDPYPGKGKANGLSFSMLTPPEDSLANIFTELEDDFKKRNNPVLVFKQPSHGDLKDWAHEGVLLLNTVLSVRQGAARSHKGEGWEEFTDAVIDAVNQKTKPVVFVLWGVDAQRKRRRIAKPHLVLIAPHPKPRRQPDPNAAECKIADKFFGSRPFSEIDEFLAKHYPQEVKHDCGVIDWRIK